MSPRELGRRKIAFLCARESLKEPRLGPQLKKIFGGAYIANEGFTAETAEAALAAGEADAVAFGKDFIANPDLPTRLAESAAERLERCRPSIRRDRKDTRTIPSWPRRSRKARDGGPALTPWNRPIRTAAFRERRSARDALRQPAASRATFSSSGDETTILQPAFVGVEDARAVRQFDAAVRGREFDGEFVTPVLAELLKVAAGLVRADFGAAFGHVGSPFRRQAPAP